MTTHDEVYEGFIYKLEHKDERVVFIGSCSYKFIKNRHCVHKNQFKKWLKNDKDSKSKQSTFEYFDKYGFDSFDFEVIKSYSVFDSLELRAKEQLWINKYNLLGYKIINKRNAVDYNILFKPRKKFITYKQTKNKSLYNEICNKIKEKRKELKDLLTPIKDRMKTIQNEIKELIIQRRLIALNED